MQIYTYRGLRMTEECYLKQFENYAWSDVPEDVKELIINKNIEEGNDKY